MSIHHMKAAAKKVSGLLARNPIGWKLVFWTWALQRGERIHPIDAHYGIRTSLELPSYLIAPSARVDGEVSPYLGCHTACVRRAVDVLPDIRNATFYDLGCGRGRALVVASEYPFRAITGIDLSPDLCTSATKNAKVIRARFPTRPPIAVVQGDAATTPLPQGRVVVFIYHSFGATTLARVVATLEAAVQRGQDVSIIYENPVHAGVIDASPAFGRWHGEQVPCTPTERSYHPDPDDAIVVWRSGLAPRDQRDDFDIVTITPERRAIVVHRPAPALHSAA